MEEPGYIDELARRRVTCSACGGQLYTEHEGDCPYSLERAMEYLKKDLLALSEVTA